MPNHIKNLLELRGDPDTVFECIEKFSTYHEATVSKTHDESQIICEKDDGGVGWLNPHTGVFLTKHYERGSLPMSLNIQRIGMPEGYEISVQDSFTRFPDFEKVIPPPDDPAYRDQPTQQEARGSRNWWYNWNPNNWGTKWNSYSNEKIKWNIYSFETAWSGVPKIIQKISSEFPSLEIYYSWADEDTGYNCGELFYKDGAIVKENFPENGSKEAYELAFKLRPDYAEGYELVDGTYEYVEE